VSIIIQYQRLNFTSLYRLGFQSAFQLIDLRTLVIAINASQCAVDITIAVVMTSLLYISRTGVRRYTLLDSKVLEANLHHQYGPTSQKSYNHFRKLWNVVSHSRHCHHYSGEFT
jgi:hypothetical protein